jgi:hypothetical protein
MTHYCVPFLEQIFNKNAIIGHKNQIKTKKKFKFKIKTKELIPSQFLQVNIIFIALFLFWHIHLAVNNSIQGLSHQLLLNSDGTVYFLGTT